MRVLLLLLLLAAAAAKNFYEVLGLPRDADADKIKKAYRKLSLKFHPGAWGAWRVGGNGQGGGGGAL